MWQNLSNTGYFETLDEQTLCSGRLTLVLAGLVMPSRQRYLDDKSYEHLLDNAGEDVHGTYRDTTRPCRDDGEAA